MECPSASLSSCHGELEPETFGDPLETLPA